MGAFARNRARIAGTSFCLFCLALFLTTYSARNPWTASVGATASSTMLRPMLLFYEGGFTGVSHVWTRYIGLMKVQQENEVLRHRLLALEAQNSRLMELHEENNRLRSIANFVEQTGLRGVSARVIGHNASNWMQTLTIGAGSSDGVVLGMPALQGPQGNGVVGQVISVGSRSARVLLLTDHSSGVDAIIQSNRVRGVLVGRGEDCVLEYVLSEDEVKVGDRVITSGMDSVFPKGLLVGIVSNVEVSKKGSNMFQSISVKPTVDFSKLEEMLLVTPIEAKLAPPAPAAEPKRAVTKKVAK